MKSVQPSFDFGEGNWVQWKDGDATGLVLHSRHYSKYFYKDKRKVNRFVGPGERIVLIAKDGMAMFVWRKFRSFDKQDGINCSIFRNEGKILSSTLILEAEQWAFNKWGKVRLYTYVNAAKIKSENPGYCFKQAMWVIAGKTKKAGLIILEKMNYKLGYHPTKVRIEHGEG